MDRYVNEVMNYYNTYLKKESYKTTGSDNNLEEEEATR